MYIYFWSFSTGWTRIFNIHRAKFFVKGFSWKYTPIDIPNIGRCWSSRTHDLFHLSHTFDRVGNKKRQRSSLRCQSHLSKMTSPEHHLFETPQAALFGVFGQIQSMHWMDLTPEPPRVHKAPLSVLWMYHFHIQYQSSTAPYQVKPIDKFKPQKLAPYTHPAFILHGIFKYYGLANHAQTSLNLTCNSSLIPMQ